MGLVAEARVSANKPLFPRFVRAALEPGDRSLRELLGEETIDEVTAKDVIRTAKALGDAMDAQREGRFRTPRHLQVAMDMPTEEVPVE